MRLNAQNRQRSEQNNHRKRRDERRKPPMPQGIVPLCPSHSEPPACLSLRNSDEPRSKPRSNDKYSCPGHTS